MADVVSQKKRSQMMAGIKSRDTQPEILMRKALYALNFRYRVCDKKLPGRPDIVFSKYRAVIFVHGCFWHGHTCNLFKWPKTREEFWRNKIEGNKARDAKVLALLQDSGWRVCIIWECMLKGKGPETIKQLAKETGEWLKHGSATHFEV